MSLVKSQRLKRNLQRRGCRAIWTRRSRRRSGRKSWSRDAQRDSQTIVGHDFSAVFHFLKGHTCFPPETDHTKGNVHNCPLHPQDLILNRRLTKASRKKRTMLKLGGGGGGRQGLVVVRDWPGRVMHLMIDSCPRFLCE